MPFFLPRQSELRNVLPSKVSIKHFQWKHRMTPITSLMNLGAKTANWLAAVGIQTAEDLEQFGVVEAYCAVKKLYPDRANLNLLYALQGAVLGMPWGLLPEAMKEELRSQASKLEQGGCTESPG
jgi:DNA transformation protein and related proteins